MLPMDRITDHVGYLVINEDGAVVSSGGELENGETIANIISSLISMTDNLEPDDEGYTKLSITFKESSYIVCLSNKRVYVVKKKFNFTPQESEIVSLTAPEDTVTA